MTRRTLLALPILGPLAKAAELGVPVNAEMYGQLMDEIAGEAKSEGA